MPNLSKPEAIEHLQRALDEIPALKGMGIDSPRFIQWERDTQIAIKHVFGKESDEIKEFNKIRYYPSAVPLGPGNQSRRLNLISSAYQSGLSQATATLKSMINQINRYWPDEQPISLPPQTEASNRQIDDKKVFVVHGRDEGTRNTVVRTLEQLDLIPIVLQEQSNEGRTIIEKFEDHAGDVGFAIVLCTPDDEGRLRDEQKSLQPRPRQNVVLEWGFFMGKIGRDRVVALTKGDVEIPSDYSGVIYIPLDEHEGGKTRLVRELKSAGFQVDANSLL